MVFVKPPTHVGIPWRFDVTLVDWVPDVLLTLNFLGDSHELEGHPLQIDSVEPAEAVWQDAITKHSVTYRLRPVKGGDPGPLHIVAFGLVEGLGQVQCCCGPPPPPPPAPPPSPRPKPPPSPWPRPPPPPPFDHLAEAQVQGAVQSKLFDTPIVGTAPAVVKSSSGEVTQYVWMSVIGVLAIGFYLRKTLTQFREHLLFRRLKKDVEMRFGKGGGGAVPPAIDADADPEGRTAGDGGVVQLCMMLPGGASEELPLDLSAVNTMRELQANVMEEWAQAGGDRRESLMMEYVDRRGRTAKVSKATTLAMLKSARALHLLPKSLRKATPPANAKSARYGRLRTDESCGSSRAQTSGLLHAIAEME